MNARFTQLDSVQRAETISMLETAAQYGIASDDLPIIAERYVWNAYSTRCPITELAGLCFEAERRAGTLRA